jgi:nucleoside-diphosphate-sugar epimerase
MDMSNTGAIFIAGASRGVGREIATILIDRGYTVVALLRTVDAQVELESLGAKVVIGDAIDYTDVDRAITTHTPIAAIISTIGGVPSDGQRADYLGNKHLIDAAKASGIPRFLLVSSLGAGATKDAIPPQAYQSLAAVLAEKERAEQHLVESGLTYTIIRPGGLKSAPATGNGVLTTATNVAGSIHRADVAALVCGCLKATNAENLILSAFDRQMTYGDVQYPEFIPS